MATIFSSVPLPILHRSIRPYLLDGAIGYYDKSLRRIRTIHDCTYTLSKHITSQDFGAFGSRGMFRGLNFRLACLSLNLHFAIVLTAALGRACVASVLALS